MDNTPLFSCTVMPIAFGGTDTTMVNMRVDVGGKSLCAFMLKSRSLEEGNHLAAVLNEAVTGIIPSHRSW